MELMNNERTYYGRYDTIEVENRLIGLDRICTSSGSSTQNGLPLSVSGFFPPAATA